jgi:hypothetical protein
MNILHDNTTLDKMYGLSNICVSQSILENMFHFLRLRESLAHVYNSDVLDDGIKNLWVQNIVIITGSLVEALLQSALERFKVIALKIGIKLNNQLLIEEINKIPFSQLIDITNHLGMFSISKYMLNDLRKLRNNIHISNSKIVLEKNKLLVAGYANFSFEIFDQLVINIHDYFKSLMVK